MRTTPTVVALLAFLGSLVLAGGGCTARRMSEVSTDAVNVLRDFDTANAIPAEQMAAAKAVAIVRESEGAALVGVSGGEGVLVRRLEDGWSPPLAIETSTASIGLQIGGQSRDIVLLLNSTSAIDRLLATGTYAIGRMEGVFVDAQGRTKPDAPELDVIPFVHTGGLFGGVSINGLTLSASDKLNTQAYGADWSTKKILAGDVSLPPGTTILWKQLDAMSVAEPGVPAAAAASGTTVTGSGAGSTSGTGGGSRAAAAPAAGGSTSALAPAPRSSAGAESSSPGAMGR